VKIHRFIYAYYKKSSNTPVYVGSAFDVAARELTHRRGHILFDKELKKHGRHYFLLRIVDSVTANNRVSAIAKAVPLENAWMDRLSTFRTSHGFNFRRANTVFINSEQWNARNASISAGLHIRLSTRKEKVRLSRQSKEIMSRPEVKAKQQAAARAQWSRPLVRKAMATGIKAAWSRLAKRAIDRIIRVQ